MLVPHKYFFIFQFRHFELSIIHFKLSIIQFEVYNRQFEVSIIHLKLYNRQFEVSIIHFRLYNRQFEVYKRQFKVSKLKNKKNIYVALIRFRKKELYNAKIMVALQGLRIHA